MRRGRDAYTRAAPEAPPLIRSLRRINSGALLAIFDCFAPGIGLFLGLKLFQKNGERWLSSSVQDSRGKYVETIRFNAELRDAILGELDRALDERSPDVMRSPPARNRPAAPVAHNRTDHARTTQFLDRESARFDEALESL